MRLLSYFILLILLITSVNALDYTDNTVYEDTIKANISATPHNLIRDGWVVVDLHSKHFNGSANGVFGFDSNSAIPTKIQYKKLRNVTSSTEYSYFLEDVYNYKFTNDICDIGNGSTKIKVNYSAGIKTVCLDRYDIDVSNYTIYWDENYSYIKKWKDIGDKFTRVNKTLDNKDRWYYIENINITVNETITFRFYLDLKGGYGKYDIAFYPSSYGKDVIQAYLDNKMILLDPTFNLTDNIMAYYKCDGDFLDSVGAKNGTVYDANYSSSYGKINEGYNYDGINDYVTLPNFGTVDNFTLSIWLYALTTSIDDQYIYNAAGTTSDHRIFIKIRESDGSYDNKMHFYVKDGSTALEAVANDRVPLNQWSFWVFVYNGSDLIFYRNGSLNTPEIVAGAASGDLEVDSQTIGAFSTTSLFIQAYLDELSFWDRDLNSTEASDLWNNSAGKAYPFTDPAPTPSGDDCNYTSGNWLIQNSCTITTDTNYGANTFTCTNNSIVNVAANVKGGTKLINDSCGLIIKPGYKWVTK